MQAASTPGTRNALLDAAVARIARLEPTAAFSVIRAGGLLIDIRSEPDRQRDGIVPGSVHIPRTVLEWRMAPEITTSIDPYQRGELAVARDAFASGIDADANRQPTDGLSDAALTLWFRAAHRRRAAGSHGAPVSETEITIDGAREPFLTVGTPNAHWVAVRRHHDVTITIAAREIDPASVIIEPIADPAARLLGPKPEEP